jgi:ankyrin repeat protein
MDYTGFGGTTPAEGFPTALGFDPGRLVEIQLRGLSWRQATSIREETALIQPVELRETRPKRLRDGGTSTTTEVWRVLVASRDGDLDAVKAMVAANPSLAYCEFNYTPPLHFAVRKSLPDMVAVLLELGADPLGRDASGYSAAAYAHSPDIDRRVMEALARSGRSDLVTALALRDFESAERLSLDSRSVVEASGTSQGVLHLMAKRGDAVAVRWLLDHGADPNARWAHWDADVTPLHMAAWGGHAEVARLLLDAGGDPTILDSKHASDAIGWAEFFKHFDVARMLEGHAKKK